MPDTYQPSDEQIEALAKTWITDWADRPADEWMDWLNDFQEQVESPAFQSIIRAAQAEALREAASVAEAYSNWKADTAFHVASIIRERAERIESADV